MKVLKVDSKKGYYSIDGITYNSIVDISKEDIYAILNIIYTTTDYKMDKYDDTTEIASDVEKLIYKNIYMQLNTFSQNKQNLVNEINDLLEDVKGKYKSDIEDKK